jgi:threonine aldolase
MTQRPRNFASDNYAGICPEALQAMTEANADHCPAYGTDPITKAACDALRDVFETNCEVFFVFNGTAANSLSLASLCRSYHSVLCHSLAHIETDECGAPEFYSGGSKILLIDGPGGKVAPDAVESIVHRRSDLHFPKPRVLSLTQSTEVGTLYDPAEISELGAITHGLGLHLHMDGARFANALASLGCSAKEITWRAGVDVLCLGGTKNGLAVGEAVVFFNPELAREFEYRCKQAGQLCSKMRYLSAPWLGVLKEGAWLRHAAHANACAQRLASGIANLKATTDGQSDLDLLFPTQANAVFARIPHPVISGLYARGWVFYDFIGAGGCRLMCSWDTTFADVDAFLTDLAELLAAENPASPDFPVLQH